MGMKKKIVRMGIAVFLLIMAGGMLNREAYPAELKIGAVDLQKAINECNEGKEAKKTLSQDIDKFQRLIAERQKELQEIKESLEKQNLMLTPEVRETKERELQSKLREFQRWGEDKQNEINQKRMEMEKTISTGLKILVRKIGTDEGYTLILEKSENLVLFASQSLDMTDRVIKAYDAQKK